MGKGWLRMLPLMVFTGHPISFWSRGLQMLGAQRRRRWLGEYQAVLSPTA